MRNVRNTLDNKHFLSLLGNGIMSVMSMATVAILCRAISIEAFGAWVFFQSILILLDTVRSGFITTAFIKFYTGVNKERADQIEGSAWYIAIYITAALSAVNVMALLLLPYIHNEGLVFIVRWFAICFWCMLPYFIGTCVLQANQRFDRLLVIRFINQVSFIIAIIYLAVVTDISLSHIVFAYAGSFLLAGVFCMAKGWIHIGTLGLRTRETVLELFHFGKYTVGTTISANLFRTSDTLIINFLLGPAALAVYNIGQRLMELVEIPLRSFAATGMPEMAASYNQDNKPAVISIMKKYAGMLTIGLVPACLLAVALADVAIAIIGGGKYMNTEAANVFRLFMTFALLYPADRFFALTLDVVHLPKINFYKVLLMLTANVFFDLMGILIFKNIYGIALATFFPIIIGTIVGFWALNKYYLKFTFFDIYLSGYQSIIIWLKEQRIKFLH